MPQQIIEGGSELAIAPVGQLAIARASLTLGNDIEGKGRHKKAGRKGPARNLKDLIFWALGTR